MHSKSVKCFPNWSEKLETTDKLAEIMQWWTPFELWYQISETDIRDCFSSLVSFSSPSSSIEGTNPQDYRRRSCHLALKKVWKPLEWRLDWHHFGRGGGGWWFWSFQWESSSKLVSEWVSLRPHLWGWILYKLRDWGIDASYVCRDMAVVKCRDWSARWRHSFRLYYLYRVGREEGVCFLNAQPLFGSLQTTVPI